LLGEEQTDGRDALVVGWPKSNGERTRVVGMPSSDGHEACDGVLVQVFPFYGCCGAGSFNHPSIWCRQHGAQQGQPVRSQCREHDCRKMAG
jgi:hypothetical protein